MLVKEQPTSRSDIFHDATDTCREAPQEQDEEVMTMRRMERRSIADDLEGLSRLSIDAVKLTTQLVEAQHSRLDWFSNRLFPDRGEDKVRNPIAALVYSSIHAVNSVVGAGLGLSLMVLRPLLGDASPSKRKDAVIAVLNGVVGDYLAAEKNPLALSMQWRTADGWLLDTDDKLLEVLRECSNGRIALLIHGSCNTPHDWWQEGHNHGTALEKSLGYMPLLLHYNTGLHISDNGRLLAMSLNRLVGLYNNMPPPTPLSLVIIAHSMGGLVARSACYCAQEETESFNSNQWLQLVSHMVTLGSPHHGAMLERGGKLVDAVLGAHRYTEPISWLGKIRSKGVMDLGHGNVQEEDWLGASGIGDFRKPTPLPKMVKCLAIAAVLGDANTSSNRLLGDSLRGDGLVTQASALGRGHHKPELNLNFNQELTIFNQSHVGLLSSQEAYNAIYSFLLEI